MKHLFDGIPLDKLPVYHRLMKRRTRAQLERAEPRDFRNSVSLLHRSQGYYMYSSYKPMTKVIVKRYSKGNKGEPKDLNQ